MKAIEGAGRAGPALIRFQTDGDWLGGARGPPRIGGRIALAAIMPAAGTDVLFVSVHLENHSDPDLRGRQMQGLLDAVDRLRRGCPPVIGGDFNSCSMARRVRKDANSRLKRDKLRCQAKHCTYACRAPKGDVVYGR